MSEHQLVVAILEPIIYTFALSICIWLVIKFFTWMFKKVLVTFGYKRYTKPKGDLPDSLTAIGNPKHANTRKINNFK